VSGLVAVGWSCWFLLASFFIFCDRFPHISSLYHELAIVEGQNLITAEIMYLKHICRKGTALLCPYRLSI
ncbi:hypothetical protein, partial [Nostoc sp. CHAB 5715]|uniref:hypothetical protein n=1 Tax=Nostoc sp. CHAB 5715 TaxID=2780400 RepID=UPI001E622FC8